MFINKLKLLIDVFRASFISLIPYYIFYSIIVLIIAILKYNQMEYKYIVDLAILCNDLFPIFINLSISYHLSIIYQISINKIIFIILSLLIFLSVELLINSDILLKIKLSEYTLLAILIPVVLHYLLGSYLYIIEKYHKNLEINLSKNISSAFTNIFPFFLFFIILTPFFYYITVNFEFHFGLKNISTLSTEFLIFIRMIFAHLFWFIGIHGGNFFDTIVSLNIVNYDLTNSLKAKEFYDLFVVLGGSGCGLSLLLAIFATSHDKHMTYIGKISFPFVIFNINEILIFGIPIIFNFSLIIPFILVPIINFILAYIAIVYLDFFTFNDLTLPWTTPALLSMYLKTDGNLLAVLFQASLISIGTLIYIPFIRKYSKIQSSTYTLDKMSDNLDLSLQVESRKDIKFREAQSSLIKSHYKVDKIIDFLNKNNIILYYQPKINIKDKCCTNFEALIRKKELNNIVKSPNFIEDVEDSGFAYIIDIWVCTQVKKDLDSWAEDGFYPSVSVNIFPPTLEDKDCVERIVSILGHCNISIEIIERRSALNSKIINNLNYLIEKGFKISLDDLGAGYTNFSVLYELPLDSIKIDKSVIDFTNTEKGLVLYHNICKLCSNLNYKIILEGIETNEQLKKLDNGYIDYIQGWYFSKALPFNEVKNFSKNFHLKEK